MDEVETGFEADLIQVWETKNVWKDTVETKNNDGLTKTVACSSAYGMEDKHVMDGLARQLEHLTMPAVSDVCDTHNRNKGYYCIRELPRSNAFIAIIIYFSNIDGYSITATEIAVARVYRSGCPLNPPEQLYNLQGGIYQIHNKLPNVLQERVVSVQTGTFEKDMMQTRK